GLSVYSPPLDEHGSCVRGVETWRRLSDDKEMHFVRSATSHNTTVRQEPRNNHLLSRIGRMVEQATLLEELHERCRIIEVTGDLAFAGTESLVRAVSEADDAVSLLVIDMQQVNEVGPLAKQMLEEVSQRLQEADRQLLLIDRGGLFDDTA